MNANRNLAFLLLIFLISCSSKEELSDAYGNFEVKKTLVSAEGNGQLIVFHLDDGQILTKGEVIGQIDIYDGSCSIKESYTARQLLTLGGILNLKTIFVCKS